MAEDNLEQSANEDFEAGKYNAAAEKYSALIAGNPGCSEYYLKRGQCYLNCKKFKEAFKDAQQALSAGDNSIELTLLGGKAATKQQLFQDAYNFYKIGVDIDNTNPDLSEGLRDLQQAILDEYELEGGDDEDKGYSAVDFCSQDPYPGDDKLLQKEQEILDAKYNIHDTVPWKDYKDGGEFKNQASESAIAAHSLMVAGKVEEAVQKFTFAIETEPNNAILRRLRSEAYYLIDDKINALRDLWVIPKNQRRVEVWRLGGQILHDLNLPIHAELWFKNATRLTDGKDEGVKVLFQRTRIQRLYAPICKGLPINVEFSDFGKCVVAAKPIKEGDELFKEKPLIMGQIMDKDNNFTLSCDNCAASILTAEDYFGSNLKTMDQDLKELIEECWPRIPSVTCDKCKKVRYCSDECRQQAWVTQHELICPARNEASKKLHEIGQNLGHGVAQDGVWKDLWDARFSPLFLARIWSSIISAAKHMMKESGDTKPTAEQWAKARSPFRKFMAFGHSSAAESMPTILNLMREIFKDCGDGVEYKITEGEFNGRYFQASCNLQTFSSPITPYHQFMTQVSKLNPEDTRGVKILKYLDVAPRLNSYCGLFQLQSCLNHSCTNNVEVSDAEIEGYGGVKVTAKSDVKEGDELFTTYIDTSMPRKLRRAWLFRSFNFWCHCRRCEFEGDGPETCTECKKKADKNTPFPACGQCHRAWYCSIPCQKSAWRRGHKKICRKTHSNSAVVPKEESAE
ncbi:uncharacterized protein LOC133175464 [Saccostrea echinata]|uniref:uncharacterized protein LOC133175464 n=1 Tax=Saccostrea echinata TaxID=191078 RepID=UPI002A83070B|nr:uncharacterized protein LOC133175464 [Saccostrea echinata]